MMPATEPRKCASHSAKKKKPWPRAKRTLHAFRLNTFGETRCQAWRNAVSPRRTWHIRRCSYRATYSGRETSLSVNLEYHLMKIVLAALLLAAAIGAQAQTAGPQDFQYDRKAALDIRDVGVTKRGDVAVHDISYASPKGGRVPAYLVVPAGKGPFAAVIWGHWYWSNSEFRNRREFLEEAVVLAYSGVISLLTDGPVARPGHVDEKDPLSDQVQSDLIQAIIDMRRGADLLLARKDVDPKRLAYVGHSYNATVGGFLSGCDHHFKAFVLM